MPFSPPRLLLAPPCLFFAGTAAAALDGLSDQPLMAAFQAVFLLAAIVLPPLVLVLLVIWGVTWLISAPKRARAAEGSKRRGNLPSVLYFLLLLLLILPWLLNLGAVVYPRLQGAILFLLPQSQPFIGASLWWPLVLLAATISLAIAYRAAPSVISSRFYLLLLLGAATALLAYLTKGIGYGILYTLPLAASIRLRNAT
jgi:hypothetical protein